MDYLNCVGNNSIPKQSNALNPIVEMSPKATDTKRFPNSFLTKYIKNAAKPDPTMLSTKHKNVRLGLL